MSTDQDSPSDDAATRIAQLNAKAAEPEPMTVDDLLSLMAVLRDAEHGCPWDREQTFATIAPFTIEEAYEVADAIARGDLPDLRTSSAICSCRSSITRGWRRRTAPSIFTPWLTRSPVR